MNEQRGRSRTPKVKQDQNKNQKSRDRSVSRSRSSKKRDNNKDTQTSLGESTQYNYASGKISGNSFRIKKREFLQNIVPQDPFAPIKIEFNPGLPESFPWLSGVAPNFEKYIVHKLKICYETAQSTFVPGMVMMAPEFNISDDLPLTKTELLEYAYAARAPVWKNFSIDISKKSIMNYRDYYIRIGSITTDKKLYDPLYIIVATDAVSTDLSYCGELWVEYDVEFTLPQIIRRPDILNAGYKQIYTGLTTNTEPFQNVISTTGGLKVDIASSSSLLFSEEFTGLINIIIYATNVGLQTSLYLSQPNWVNLSSSGSVTSVSGVGGSGQNADDNGYTALVIFCQAIPKGGIIQINNLGYFTNGGLTAINCLFKFNRGLW